MGSRIWVREDVLNALRAAHIASEGSVATLQDLAGCLGTATVSADQLLSAYRSGFSAALTAVGVAFGLGEGEGPSLGVPTSPSEEDLPWLQGHARPETAAPRGLARLLIDSMER